METGLPGSKSAMSRMALAGTLIVLASFPGAARAFTFTRVGDGAGQSLIYSWSRTYEDCSGDNSCGNVAAADGRIPLNPYISYNFEGGVNVGGMLDWATSSEQLHAIATPAIFGQVGIEILDPGRTEVAATVDARTTPLRFQMVAESGDPPTANIQITPRLEGVVNLYPGNSSGSTTAALRYFMSVEANQAELCRDSLIVDLSNVGGPSQSIPVAFPRGSANNASLIGFTEGTELTFYLWASADMVARGHGSAVFGSSAGQGRGPAIVVDVSVTPNTTDVPGSEPVSRLRVSARPNPSRGVTRVAYVIPRPADVRLSVYDLSGARVAKLVDRFESAGPGGAAWDGTDAHGRRVAPGVYVVELTAGAERVCQRLFVFR